MELTALTLSEAASRLESRDLSPVELTRAHLDRIAAVDAELNSYITVTSEEAMRSAVAAEAEISRGHYRGPLHGIPLALKDLIESAGVRTTAGSSILREYIPETDSTVVCRLREAGAVILGKLNMHEFAMSVTNDNPHFGDCRNPWDLERIPGGSSGGAAAALAAELCLGALGSDTAGSIRIPAALCGVVGLKPTYGRVSKRGTIPLSWHLDHIGPMARQVRDIALLLEAISGYDAADPDSREKPGADGRHDLQGPIRGWRVAAATIEDFLRPDRPCDPEIVQTFEEALAVFETLGARIFRTTCAGARSATHHALRMSLSDAAAYHAESMQHFPERFGQDVRQSLERGGGTGAVEYASARRAQHIVRRQFDEFFKEFDILVMPTTPVAAPLRGDQDREKLRPALVSFTALWNFTGHPAITIPSGRTRNGLPVGLQIVSARWAEDTILRAAYAFEQVTEWSSMRPPMPWLPASERREN